MPDNTVARINVSLDKEHKELLERLTEHLYLTKKIKPQAAVILRLALKQLAILHNVK